MLAMGLLDDTMKLDDKKMVLSSPNARQPLSLLKTLSLLALSAVTLTGCSTVKVGTRSTAQAILAQRTTALTGNRLSNDTQSRLLQAGLDADKCLQNMPLCLVQLKNASLTQDKGLYGAYSELYYAAATRHRQGDNCQTLVKELNTDYAKTFVGSQTSTPPTDLPTNATPHKISCQMAYQDDLLQSARFAFIYLMFDELPKTAPSAVSLDAIQADATTEFGKKSSPQSLQTPTRATKDNAILRASGIDAEDIPKPQRAKVQYPPNERDIEIQDLYYVAIDELGDDFYEKNLEEHYTINSNQLNVTVNNQPFSDRTKAIKLVSSYQINLSGLNTISRRDGFGMNYVAVMDDRYTTSIRNQILNHQGRDIPLPERIHPLGHLPMTALLVPKGNDLASLLTTNTFTLYLYDPYQFNTLPLFDKDLSLSANFSASYGLWLNENRLDPVSLLNLFSRRYQTAQPQLFMLEPYNPHKRVIIMLHGLGSSPATWIGLTNDIFNDPKLRDNYQVWQVFYPTNIPILENRYQINELLTAAFKQVDPSAQDAASHHAVIIGHSMGGVIGRMLVSNDNLTPQLDKMLGEFEQQAGFNRSYRQISKMSQQSEFRNRFVLHAMPQVDRAVFISSPFRGTSYADKWFTRTLRRVISLPKGFVTLVTENLQTLYSDHAFAGSPLAKLFLENGASQLSDKSFFVKLTQGVKIANNVTVNSIIATDDKDLLDALSSDISQAAQTPEDTHLGGTKGSNGLTDNDSSPALTQAASADSGAAISTPSATLTTPPAQPASTAVNLYTPTNLDKAEQKVQQNQQLLETISQGATDRVSDGIVPYNSAHLEGVESEKILAGRHNVHTSPQAILELRRILHRHLSQQGTPSDASAKTADVQP